MKASFALFVLLGVEAPTQAYEARQNIDDFSKAKEPLWEYGLGLGYAQFEQYPAAGRMSRLLVPFPTFQYRGETVRADDREGARAYLFQGDSFSLEMAGTGSPPLSSKDNSARKGLRDLPFILAIGPQLIYRNHLKEQMLFETSLGLYPALMMGSSQLRAEGAFFQFQMGLRQEHQFFSDIRSLSRFFLTWRFASQEIQDEYFGVRSSEVTSFRQQFRGKAGLLGTEATLFQTFKHEKLSYYVGLNYINYQGTAHEKSSLSKAKDQLNTLVGLIYSLGESTEKAQNNF